MNITVSDFKNESTVSQFTLLLTLPSLTIFLQPFLLIAKYSWNPFQFSDVPDYFYMLVSKLDSSNLTTTSSFLNLQQTMTTPLSKSNQISRYLRFFKALLMQNLYKFITFYNLGLIDFKQLRRFCQKTIKQQTRLKLHLTSTMNQVFSELQYFLKSSLHQ